MLIDRREMAEGSEQESASDETAQTATPRRRGRARTAQLTQTGEGGGGGGGDGNGSPTPPPPLPPFQPAYYIFSLPSFRITQTRAWDDDTDLVSLALQCGSQMMEPVTRDMGNVDNGTHEVDLRIGPVAVTHPDMSICLNYLIMNSNAEHKPAEWETYLLNGAKTLIGYIPGVGPLLNKILNIPDVEQWLSLLLNGLCDGPVAANQFRWSGLDLWELTNGVSNFTVEDFHRGYASPPLCNPVESEYWVTWRITGAGIIPPSAVPTTFQNPAIARA
jgi:hypothetical protein